MKIYNKYILTLALLLLLTTIVLAGFGQNSLDIYYSLYVIEALVITELYVFLSAKARRGLSVISLILFGGFLFVVALQVIKIVA